MTATIDFDARLIDPPAEPSYLVGEDVRAFDMAAVVRVINRDSYLFGCEGTIMGTKVRANGTRQWSVWFADEDCGGEVDFFSESELRFVR